MNRFVNEEGGATAIEYALLASMTGMVLAGVLGELREGVGSLFVIVATLTGGAVG